MTRILRTTLIVVLCSMATVGTSDELAPDLDAFLKQVFHGPATADRLIPMPKAPEQMVLAAKVRGPVTETGPKCYFPKTWIEICPIWLTPVAK